MTQKVIPVWNHMRVGKQRQFSFLNNRSIICLISIICQFAKLAFGESFIIVYFVMVSNCASSLACVTYKEMSVLQGTKWCC